MKLLKKSIDDGGHRRDLAMLRQGHIVLQVQLGWGVH